jgi:hypothetical protein
MSQEQHPAFSPARIAMRQHLGLRVVTEEEEGRNIENQPVGVYGFTGAPASDELPMFIKPFVRCTEVHKLQGGDIAIVGYVTGQEWAAFEAGTEPITLHLYPDPHREADRLISVPLRRIDCRRPPARDDGNPMMIDLAPVI